MTAVAFVLLALAPRPALGLGLGICAPDSARQAYDAILAAAPDGSELESQARGIADEARGRGSFDSDDTTSRLDELARGADYAWDCQVQVYRYAPPTEDPSGEDEAAVTESDIDPGDAGFAEADSGDPGSMEDSGPSVGSDADSPEAFANESVAVPDATRPDPPARPDGSLGEATAGSRPQSGAEAQEPRHGTPLTTVVPASPSARLSVGAGPGSHDGGTDVLRWLIAGVLPATGLVVWRRRR